MFKFTIRDLLWLTLVVALGLGWGVREQQLRARAEQAGVRATRWRGAAGALEFFIKRAGYEVTWGGTEWVVINDGGRDYQLSCDFEPSANED